jgi:biotin operon repressor/Fe2+ or Zn2+ uptake regulation protein
LTDRAIIKTTFDGEYRVPQSSDTNEKLIAGLRDQLNKAQETILQLQQLLQAQSGNLHEGIKLTPNQRTVVDMLLVTNGICTNENLYAALYVSKQGHKPDPKILDEMLRLIRRQLSPHGIEIKAVFGKGYTMTRESKAKLKELFINLQAQSGNLYEGIKLTRNQRTVVDMLLVTNGICTKESLYAALYVSKQGHKPDPKILDEMLRVIRKQLRPLGIEIKTVFGKGYTMPVESKVKLKELIIK